MIDKLVNGELEKLSKHPIKKVSGLVKDYKKSPFRKFTDVFFEEDIHTVKESLVREIVIPTIKNFMADIFIGGIERALFGESRGRRSPTTNYSSSLVRSITNISGYRDYSSQQKQQQTNNVTKKFTLDDVVMSDRASAEDLRLALIEEINTHGSVSVAQLYDSISDESDIGNMDFANNYYGWKNLDGLQIAHVGYGMYKLIFPKPVQLD